MEVIVGGVSAAAIVMVNCFESLPATFSTSMAMENVPALLGVPEISPLVDMANPRLARDV